MNVEGKERDLLEKTLIEEPVLPTVVNTSDLLEEVTQRVTHSLARGYLHRAIRACVDIHEQKHGLHARDIEDDPICVWTNNDRLCAFLDKAGFFTMADLMQKRPVDFLKVPQVSESYIREIARAQAAFRTAMEKMKNSHC